MATEQEKYYKRKNEQAAAQDRAAKQREKNEKESAKAWKNDEYSG